MGVTRLGWDVTVVTGAEIQPLCKSCVVLIPEWSLGDASPVSIMI